MHLPSPVKGELSAPTNLVSLNSTSLISFARAITPINKRQRHTIVNTFETSFHKQHFSRSSSFFAAICLFCKISWSAKSLSVVCEKSSTPEPLVQKSKYHEASSQYPARSPSVMSTKSNLAETENVREPSPRHTAASIANAHFQSEINLQNDNDGSRTADTVVILHDSCYGHRYSRPKTSRSSLNTIVERPERIHASILGLSVAYVRLGERHSEGRYPLYPGMDASTIPSTPFNIRKTTRRMALSSQAITNVHGTKWMEELKIMCDNAEAKLALNGKELVRPDMNRGPGEETPAKFHEGDLYLCSESLEAMEGALGAVCEGVDAVFEGSSSGRGPRRTFVVIRPPGHHCSASYPSGFCWLNNVHVGISHAALTHGLTHAAIIDFDLHHGDGSQAIAWEHNARANGVAKNAQPWKKTSIGYFSLHDINSYPCEMGDQEKVKNASLCIENAHGQNIWNVHLQPWKDEAEFWDLYETRYSVLLEKTRSFLRTQTDRFESSSNLPKPKAAIFLSAGFDASEWESSGMQRHKVNVPTEFYARLTRDVVKLAAEEGTGVDGRIISVLEGGYSDRALCTGVLSHLSGLAGSDPIDIKSENSQSGLNFEMGRRIDEMNGSHDISPPSPYGVQPYDPLWWSLGRLEQLDAAMTTTEPQEPAKPSKDTATHNFSSPTQSFIAKVANTPKAQRSVSTMSFRNGISPRASVARTPTPPPPDVHWTVAAHELSKLLIPTDRQTKSCQWEDLSAEATRARRDRQSVLGQSDVAQQPTPVESTNNRMALRTRKSAKVVETVEKDESRKPAVKSGRRKTVAGAGALANDKAPTLPKNPIPLPEPRYAQGTQQSARRLSTSSTTGSVISESVSSHRSPPVTQNRVPSFSQRPGSSMGVRPGSSMSSRGPAPPPIVVKKTRAPAQPRNDAAKPSRARKKGLNNTPNEPPHGGTAATDSIPPTTVASNATSDMDSLTSGMKKIKINLITKAQREAKEQEKLQALAKQHEAEVPGNRSNENEIVASYTEAVPMAVPTNASVTTPVRNISPISPTHQPPLPAHLPVHMQEAEQIPLPASSPVGPSTENFESGNHSDQSSEYNADKFVPFQPQGPPPSMIAQNEPLRWLPPNTGNISPMKRSDLPVFTSTSTIPFGISPNPTQNRDAPHPSTSQNPHSPVPSQLAPSIWDVPVTPQK
ncbi:histone deacetylase HOS3 protein [Rutstroemia sp. NJR-2017a BBW]|nr:histone deacetylase HOS3 protein [Rutstroemia sp. NJR-2017a BBW]